MTQMTQNNFTAEPLRAPILLCAHPLPFDVKVIGEYWFFSGKSIYKTFDTALRYVKRRHNVALHIEYDGLHYRRTLFGCRPQNAYYNELHQYSFVDKHGNVVDTLYMCRSVIVYDAYKYALKKWGGVL